MPEDRTFAEAWRRQPKWVVSRSLKSVGPNATLVSADIEATVRTLKAQHNGEIDVAGPALAQNLADPGLIDEYRLYYHPLALGGGKPFFAGPRPSLRLADWAGRDQADLRSRVIAGPKGPWACWERHGVTNPSSG